MHSAVLRDTLEEIRKAEGAESFTEVIKDIHFYPDLHGQSPPFPLPSSHQTDFVSYTRQSFSHR